MPPRWMPCSPAPAGRSTTACSPRARWRWPSTASSWPSRPSATPPPTPATRCSRPPRPSWPPPCGRSWATGSIDERKLVVDYIPEFGTNGKDVITVEQVMLHTAGFPHAPLGPPVWSTRAGRVEAFGRWSLNWEPGSTYEYHPTSAHWVLAEIIDRVTGGDYRDVVQERVTDPAGLPRVLGLEPGPAQEGIATVVSVGEPATAEEIKATFGVDSLPVTEVTPEALLAFNRPRRARRRRAGRRGRDAGQRPGPLLPGAPAQPRRDLGARRPRRRHRPRAQPAAGALDRRPGQPQPRADPGRRRRLLQRPGPRPHRVTGRLRAQRRRRPAGLGRPGHRPVVRLLHQRHRPARRARAPPRDRAQQPRGRLRLEPDVLGD